MGWTLDSMEIDRFMKPHYDGSGMNDWWEQGDQKFFYIPNPNLKTKARKDEDALQTFRLLYNGTAYPLIPEVITRAYGLYHTRDEQFLSIERHNPQEGDNSAPNETGKYWTVRLKDGTEYRLGYNEDAEQVTHSECYSETITDTLNLDWQTYAGDVFQKVAFRWRVDRVQDTRGNRIEYSYKTEDSVGGPRREIATYMKEIRYNFQGGVPLARVRFTFDGRHSNDGGLISDEYQKQRDYALPFYQKSHLDHIQVFVRSTPAVTETLLRDYKLDFNNIDRPDGCQFRVLNYIRESGTEGETSQGFNATTMGYIVEDNKASNPDPEASAWEREDFKHPRLDHINNGYGGIVDVAYHSVDGDYTHPQNHLVLWKKAYDNNGGSRVAYAVATTGRSQRCCDDNGDGICNPAAGDDYDLVGFKTVTETLQTTGGTGVGRTVHTFCWSPPSAPSATLGRERLTQHITTDGDLIQQTETEWAVYTYTFATIEQPFTSTQQCYFVYPAVVSDSTTLGDTNPVLPPIPQKVTTYGYDLSYGNQLTVTEIISGAIYRRTVTDYYANPGAWIIDRPACARVYDGQGRRVSESRTVYDDPANTYDTPPVRGEPVATTQLASLGPEEWITQTVTYITRTVAYSEPQMLDGVLVTPTLEYAQTLPVLSADALSRTTVTEYDDTWTRVLTVTPPVTEEYTHYQYDAWGRVLTETTANGEVYYDYDTLGRLTQGVLPGDSLAYPTVKFAYCDTCSVLRIMTYQRLRPGEAATIPTIRFYNGLGQLIQESQGTSDSSQMRTSYTYYSRWGSVASSYVPYSRTYSAAYVTPDTSRAKTTYSFDAIGRPTLTTYPDDTMVQTAYDGLKKAVLDENGHQVQYETDALGRLVEVREYDGTYTAVDWDAPVYATTRYGYDLFDRLVAFTDTLGNVTTIAYDPLGRKVAMHDPDMGDWEYGDDAVGTLITQTDHLGQQTIFTYDDANRVIAKAYGAGEPPAVEYLYGSEPGVVGYRLAMTDTSGSTAWTYDARGRVVTETKTVGDETFVTGWTYDQRDQVLTQTYPRDNQGNPGEVVTTEYDEWGKPYSLVGEDTYVNSTFLDSAGRPDMIKLGLVGTASVIKLDYIYYAWDTANGRGRLKQIKAGPPTALDSLQNLTYTYDAAGNVTRIQLTQPTPTEDVTFQYDALNRLTSASAPYNETTAYDEIGNIISKTGTAYTYPTSGPESERPHAVTAAGDNTYGYDPNGNMVTRSLPSGTFYLRYDPENRLVAVDKQDGEALARIAEFGYDGDGNRVRGVVTATSAVATTYIGAYFEWVAPGTAVKYYYLGGKRVAMTDGDPGTHWLLGDHLGSTSITTDGSGNKTGELRYAAWGETRYEWGTTPTKYRYAGQPEEADIGLYLMGARWYDRSLGRWLGPDSIVPNPRDPQALNRYTYVGNNPGRYIDPTGHLSEDEIMKYLGLTTWEEVVALFTSGALKDRPGYLEVLRTAELGDTITIFAKGAGSALSEAFSGVLTDLGGSLYIASESESIAACDAASLGDVYVAMRPRITPNGTPGFEATQPFFAGIRYPHAKYDFSSVDKWGLAVDCIGILGDLSLRFLGPAGGVIWLASEIVEYNKGVQDKFWSGDFSGDFIGAGAQTLEWYRLDPSGGFAANLISLGVNLGRGVYETL